MQIANPNPNPGQRPGLNRIPLPDPDPRPNPDPLPNPDPDPSPGPEPGPNPSPIKETAMRFRNPFQQPLLQRTLACLALSASLLAAQNPQQRRQARPRRKPEIPAKRSPRVVRRR